MKNFTPMPTANKKWGFWGTSNQSGHKTAELWNATCHFFAEKFDLNAEQARDLLDARFGRHLVDDFSFITGEKTAKSIVSHLNLRLADAGWRKHFEKSICDETSKTYPCKAVMTKDKIFTEIAHKHLNIETLVERKSDSLDYHDVGVLNVQAALAAAYEAGRASRKK